MSKFKIGQRVVAIVDHSQGEFKKGDEFIVDGFYCCPKCGIQCINILGKNDYYGVRCTECKEEIYDVRESYMETSFAPIQSFGEQIEEQLSKEANEVSDWMIEAIQPKP